MVDDDPMYRDIGKFILEELGFVCDEASNGLEAYRKCLQSMPDLILLDWNMPVMNGYEFLINLRKESNGHVPKVIFSTSETAREYMEKGIAAGADAYLGKPLDFELLAEKITQMRAAG